MAFVIRGLKVIRFGQKFGSRILHTCFDNYEFVFQVISSHVVVLADKWAGNIFAYSYLPTHTTMYVLLYDFLIHFALNYRQLS